MKSLVITTVACAALLTACQQNGRTDNPTMGGTGINKSDVGTVIGAGLGGWAGHNIGSGSGQTVATIAGTLLGAALGQSLGQSLDSADIAAHNTTAQRALETGQSGNAFPWSNPQTGASGTITPSNYYQTAQGGYCREYQQTITVNGEQQRGYGTACRQPDGSWKVVQ